MLLVSSVVYNIYNYFGNFYNYLWKLWLFSRNVCRTQVCGNDKNFGSKTLKQLLQLRFASKQKTLFRT